MRGLRRPLGVLDNHVPVLRIMEDLALNWLIPLIPVYTAALNLLYTVVVVLDLVAHYRVFPVSLQKWSRSEETTGENRVWKKKRKRREDRAVN